MDFLKDIKKTSDLLMGKEEKYQEILLSKILEDPFQPRKEFTAADIDDLAESIKLHGVLSPITVRKTKVEGDDNECFALCYGERRYRAAKQAGLISIPAIVINGEIEDIKEKQLVENIQRKELSFDEIADTIKYLIDIKKMKKKDIAKSLSKSNSYVSLYYNYAKIDGYIRDLLIEKTKDITLIVEINKFLCNAEAGIKDAALQCIMNEDSINRNIIDRLNNLNEITNDEPIISDEDLARPNIEDYLDEPEDIIINETVQKLEVDKTGDNELIKKNTKNNASYNECNNEITPQKELAEQIISEKVYLDTKTSEICKFDGSVIMKLTSNTSKMLIQQNKIINFLKDIDTYIVPYFNE
ncbi:MAG: ParB/RepB/Spo0J family partition protein [Mucispirillum sp.]|nr:ParB/RepB/Spo0J family partition protein [Mucispirillum sp.]